MSRADQLIADLDLVREYILAYDAEHVLPPDNPDWQLVDRLKGYIDALATGVRREPAAENRRGDALAAERDELKRRLAAAEAGIAAEIAVSREELKRLESAPWASDEGRYGHASYIKGLEIAARIVGAPSGPPGALPRYKLTPAEIRLDGRIVGGAE